MGWTTRRQKDRVWECDARYTTQYGVAGGVLVSDHEWWGLDVLELDDVMDEEGTGWWMGVKVGDG
jgi:hypothetical protein